VIEVTLLLLRLLIMAAAVAVDPAVIAAAPHIIMEPLARRAALSSGIN
jgi:hypothetical protein